MRAPLPGKNKLSQGARLRLDDDEPMDLLQGAAVKITSTACAFVSVSLWPDNNLLL